MRIMGLDVGEKRIGIAVSDPMGWTAQSHSVLYRKHNAGDFKYLIQLCKELEVEKIIVGYPRNMNGTIGPKALEIEEFAKELGKHTILAIEFWDERLTTRSAERVLLEADISRHKRKHIIDKLAAAYILQGYLDSILK
ncbi:MAG: Holliday junction resolvase RuvX [Syntrophomonadaceae bacterium]|nr:Holliday junction resolvase RuvX [Syntrophomonadaceae bacterium]MDD3023343.1 Holliday junction resolvase RuvX [Syntrophomonadaceae bacterium]